MRDERVERERYELSEPPVYVFRVNRRQFVGTLGAGLLITAASRAQGPDKSNTPPLQARLHIGEDGRITILSGKVEEGQGPRTELAMAAAEELRVPLPLIDVQMADTSVSPDDWITAGSRTTSGTVPEVRRAAAVARELLTSVAAGRNFTYRDLARSPELTKAYTQQLPPDLSLTAPKQWAILGTPRIRSNGSDIVTGAHRYPSDIQRPGKLY